MPAKTKHVYRVPTGWRVRLRINGRLHQRHFPPATLQRTMQQWIWDRQIQYRHAARSGRFDDDATAYLQAVRAMPTYEQRQQHIQEWVALFGPRPRAEITAADIAAQLHTWRTTKAAATVNKRRTALMHLYATLDGRSLPNPVKDTPRFPEPRPAPRALSYADIRRIFDALPDGRSKARLMVIAYTGMPQAQIASLTPQDVDFDTKTVAVEGRRKGAGTGARIVPLTDYGVAAFRLMAATEAWGSFSRPTLRNIFRRACQRALGHHDVTPYDLRHSFGTELYRASGDIRATQILMDHSTPQLTHRYTLAAVDPRVKAALAKFVGT